MKKALTTYSIFFIVWSAVIAQTNLEFTGKYYDRPYQQNNISEVKGYLVSNNDSLDDILIEHEFFNEYAFLLKRYNFSKNGSISNIDSFVYEKDTILRYQITKPCNSKSIYITELDYNKEGKIHTSISNKAGKIISKRKYKYIEKDRKIIVKSTFGKKEVLLDEYNRIKYTKDESKGNKNGRKYLQLIEYNKDSSEVTKIYFKENSQQYVHIKKYKDHRVEIENNSGEIWHDLDFSEPLRMKVGDKIEKNYIYDENGLLISKSRYINNIFDCKIKYEYEK